MADDDTKAESTETKSGKKKLAPIIVAALMLAEAGVVFAVVKMMGGPQTAEASELVHQALVGPHPAPFVVLEIQAVGNDDGQGRLPAPLGLANERANDFCHEAQPARRMIQGVEVGVPRNPANLGLDLEVAECVQQLQRVREPGEVQP